MPHIPLPAAPGADEHVSVALLNSAVSLPGGRRVDELADPEEATAWLVGHHLVPERTTLLAYCQHQLVGLRDDLRTVFGAHVAGERPPQRALDAINRALTSAPNALLLDHEPGRGLYRASAHPVTQLVEHAMARIAEDAAALLTGDRAAQVARCEASPCDRFLVRTHGRRHWCSTRCGDRVRAARAYARKQSGAPATARAGRDRDDNAVDRGAGRSSAPAPAPCG